jgi:hypothetical protein
MRVKVTGHIEPDIASAIEKLAAKRGVSVSSVVSEMLQKAVVVEASEWGESVIIPLLEEVIRKEISAGLNRLARLLVRVGLEAGTARSLIAHQLWAVDGIDREQVRRLSDGYWSDTVRRLKTPIEDLPELIQALTEVGTRTRSASTAEAATVTTNR